jgi:membrane protease subunit (stomatin/prohibitin family)
VYFISTKRFIDLKWGTKNPIMVRDPEFSMVRLRAFGTYEIRISDAKTFLNEIVGTDGHFTTDEVESQLTNLIVSKFATIMGQDDTPALDLAANYEKFSTFITEHMAPSFNEYGLELTRMLVENISLPEEVEKAMDKRTSRAITGNLDDHMKYQGAEALGNENGGSMSDMMGMGVGMAMGQQMANSMNSTNTPPSLPNKIAQYFVAVDGKSEGPYSLENIQESINDGRINRQTLIWTQGMQEWAEASSVLSDKFSQTPPPLN